MIWGNLSTFFGVVEDFNNGVGRRRIRFGTSHCTKILILLLHQKIFDFCTIPNRMSYLKPVIVIIVVRDPDIRLYSPCAFEHTLAILLHHVLIS